MAPLGWFVGRLREYYLVTDQSPPPPVMSTTAAIALLLLYTLVYVLPFYASPTSRPSPTLSRDAPSVIRARIRAVSLSCALCTAATVIVLSTSDQSSPLQTLHLLGYWPIGVVGCIKSVSLTALLFLGPIFEVTIVEGEWRNWIRLRGLSDTLRSWIGYRNLVAGPVTEEILFRSVSIPLLLLSQTPIRTVIFLTPLVFGAAHLHHFYEFRISHPHTPLTLAITRSLFQLAFTTFFGSYVTFVYLRTGSLLAVVLIHSFCNFMGLPRFWGRVQAPEVIMAPDTKYGFRLEREGNGNTGDGERDKKSDGAMTEEARRKLQVADGMLGISWTIAYYILLVIGAVGWYKQLWALTESPNALAEFSGK